MKKLQRKRQAARLNRRIKREARSFGSPDEFFGRLVVSMLGGRIPPYLKKCQ